MDMVPMAMLGWGELLVILLIVVVLFGTSRIAGIGKASGRAIREFKEETKDLSKAESQAEITDEKTAETKQADVLKPDKTQAE